MTEPRSEWDDERLGAAFTARAAGAPPTPPDLAPNVMDRVGRRARRGAGLAPWLTAAAGIVVVVAVAAVFGVQPGRHPPGTTPSTPGGSQPGRTVRTASAAAVLGDPMTVSAAIAIRDGDGATDRELIVTGYLSPMPILFCPFDPSDRNPTQLGCPQSFQWLMEQPEILMTIGSDTKVGGPPEGPAFHPSFALVEPPNVPIPTTGPAEPVPVVLVGHFHDRRAALCATDPLPDRQQPCADVFVVDRVAEVNGEPRGVVTRRRNERFDDATQRQVTVPPVDLEEDLDRLVLADVRGGSILSRQLVTIDQVIGIEPVLKDDGVIPYIGNPATLMWIVTVLAPGDVPRARTFALMDGSNWFGEVTATGMVMIERSGLGPPPGGSGMPIPSADPTAFDAAPTSVLGIPVRDIATVELDRRAVMDDLGRDELAIKGWYVGPDPTRPCQPTLPAIHPPTPPCDGGRHWLLDRPDQLLTEAGQVRTNPEHWPSVLNPILPVDVPFEVAPTWAGGVVDPQPVIVLGHFLDNRVDTYAGNVYFVVDALAWSRDRGAGSIDALTRLTSAATEDPGAVLARIAEVSPNDAVATWTTVVDAANFAALEPRTAADAPEFTSGAPVWIVRRLIHSEMDGRQRLAIEWSYTADRGSRIWMTETPDSSPDLATTLDLHDLDARTRLVRVFDYEAQVVAVRSTAGLKLAWHRIEPREAGLDAARGASDREVAIRWTSGACDPEWQILLRSVAGGKVDVTVRTFGDFCPGDRVTRSVMVEFDRPIALDALSTTYNPSGG